MEIKSIVYGKRNIYYQISYRDRKTLKISVEPNLEVKVVAPESSTEKLIEEKLRKRASWIIKQQNYFKEFLPITPPRKYVNGETHMYLGKQYRLKIVQNHIDKVSLKAGRILVRTRHKQPLMIEYLLGGWYKSNAERIFQKILEDRIGSFTKYNIDLPPLKIKRLKNKWGSCSSKGIVTLNPELIKAPKGCIEYVVNHELCHLVEHNHSKKFYSLQEKTMPDWAESKQKLEKALK